MKQIEILEESIKGFEKQIESMKKKLTGTKDDFFIHSSINGVKSRIQNVQSQIDKLKTENNE